MDASMDEIAALAAAKAQRKLEKAEKAARKAAKAEKRAAAGDSGDEAVVEKVARKEKSKDKESKKRKRSSSEDDDDSVHTPVAADVESKKQMRNAEGQAVSVQKASAFCAEHNMKVTGINIDAVHAMTTWDSAATAFLPKQMAVLRSAGYPAPTATQALAWPLSLLGKNIVTVAKTGSGKTLGFLIPVFHQILTAQAAATGTTAGSAQALAATGSRFGSFNGREMPGPAKPILLVMAPTRELACQIEVEAKKFGSPLGLRTACVYGGAPKGLQIRTLKMGGGDGAEIVIGTPGRLQDLMNMGVLSLANSKFLVLDEADRMLDMGFEPDMRAIIGQMPVARQTLLFTATWPRVVQKLAQEFAPGYIQMSVGDTDSLQANKAITQAIEIISGDDAKARRLLQLFKELYTESAEAAGSDEGKKAAASAAAGAAAVVVNGIKILPDHGKSIVFVKLKSNCNRVAQGLWDAGFAVNTLHGDMEQNERTRVIDAFRTGKLRVLVATDVAARGLDVKDVTHVFNYDFPFGRNGVEDYVHRIGRTGRAGKSGASYTFFDPREDSKNASELVKVLEGAGQAVPEELMAMARRFGGGGRGGGGGRFGGGGGRFGGGGGRGGKPGYGGGKNFGGDRKARW